MEKNSLEIAKKILMSGELVIFPTETVYGLGGDATNDVAVDRIFESKNRPKSNPIICHFANIEKVKKNFKINYLENLLIKEFWPGPLTIILEKNYNSKISKKVSNNSCWIGCRIPNNSLTLKLLNSLSFPVAAPSANITSKTSVTYPGDLNSELKKNIFTLSDGSSSLGLESTVIRIKNDKIEILRLGSLTEEQIHLKFPNIEIKVIVKSNLSPGNQLKHYSPNKPIRINVKNVENDEVLLNFGSCSLVSKLYNLNLSKKGNLLEASNNFYHYLHKLDKHNSARIAVVPIPNVGLGKTINDRLLRASFVKKL